MSRRAYRSQPAYSNYKSASNVLYALIGLNSAIFIAWNVAAGVLPGLEPRQRIRLLNFMSRNFVCSKANVDQGRWWTVVTSTFSHQSLMHIIGNMFSLHAFGSVVAAVGIGPLNTIIITLGAGLAGSLGYLYHESSKSPWERSAGAMGASGSVMGMGAAAACLAPKVTMLLFGVVPVPLWALMIGYGVIDNYYLDRQTKVAHSGHIGGMIFGGMYYFARLRRFGGVASKGLW